MLNKKAILSIKEKMKKIISVFTFIFPFIFCMLVLVALRLGSDLCRRRGEYVNLPYSYGHHFDETGSSCSLYYDGRWISATTYYEYNNISYSEIN